MGLVVATEHELASRDWAGRTVEPEGKQVRLHKTLGHHGVPDGGGQVDGDIGKGHAEDAIKVGSDEGNSRLGRGLAKDLLLFG